MPHPNECGRKRRFDRATTATEPLNSSEAEAIERAKQGDAEAFQALYDKHKRRVYSLCLRMTANTAEAEDLAQEAFLQLYRKIANVSRRVGVFDLVAPAFGQRRADASKKEEPSRGFAGRDHAGTEDDSPKKDFGADDVALAGSIDRLQLQRAVKDLPPGYRTIFVLHDVEGYEHNEIAEMVGCSIGNSKSQLHKARMKLRDLLKMNRAEKAGKSRAG